MKPLVSMLPGLMLWLLASGLAGAAETSAVLHGTEATAPSWSAPPADPSSSMPAKTHSPFSSVPGSTVYEGQRQADRGPSWWQAWWAGWAACLAAVVAIVVRRRIEWSRLRAKFERRLEAGIEDRMSRSWQEQDKLLQGIMGVLFLVQAAQDCQAAHPGQAAAFLERALLRGDELVRESQATFEWLSSHPQAREDFIGAIVKMARATLDSEDRFLSEFRVYQEGAVRVLRPLLRDELYLIIGASIRTACVNTQPARIEVELDFSRESLRVRVRDDGDGLSELSSPVILPGDSRRRRRMRSIRRQVRALGGRFRAWSRLRAGTEIELTFQAPEAYIGTAEHFPWVWNMTSWSWTP